MKLSKQEVTFYILFWGRQMNVLCFAQATVQKLLTEGVQLNSPAVPAQDVVSEDDPQWIIYR